MYLMRAFNLVHAVGCGSMFYSIPTPPKGAPAPGALLLAGRCRPRRHVGAWSMGNTAQ